MFQRLTISAAATVILMTGTAHAVTVTIAYNSVTADVSDNAGANATDRYTGTSIPTSDTLTVVDGGNTSETEINHSTSAGTTTLSYDVSNTRTGIGSTYSTITGSSVRFSVDEDTLYELSGFYDVTDVGEPGRVFIYTELYDNTGETLIDHYQESRRTNDESFILGELGGDTGFDYLDGSLTGQLKAGRTYSWSFQALIQANGDSGATAVGNFTLTIGGPSVVPLPAAFPLFLSGLVGLGVVGWRKHRRELELDA